MFYDSKIGKRIMACRLVIGMLSDGKISIPIDCAYLFSAELTNQLKLFLGNALRITKNAGP